MPKGYAPSIFVSSTCFDLSQIRADIGEFIKSLGLDPIISDLTNRVGTGFVSRIQVLNADRLLTTSRRGFETKEPLHHSVAKIRSVKEL